MYLIYAVIIMTLYIFTRGLINKRDKRYRNLDNISMDDILEHMNTKIVVKWKTVLIEATFLMTIVVLLWMAAFHSGFSEGREVVFVLMGILLFFISFLKLLYSISMELKYDENYIYLKKGFSNIKLDINKVTSIGKLNAHISINSEERFFLCYISTNFTHSHIVYKLLKDNVDKERKK